MKTRTKRALLTLASTVCGLTTFAQASMWSDDFDDDDPIGWTPWPGYPSGISETNQQFSLTGSFTGPMNPAKASATHIPAYRPVFFPDALADQQTLELRVDRVGASQNDAWAGISVAWSPGSKGYVLFMDQDEVCLCKFYSGSFAFFFYELPSIQSQNTALALGLTRYGSNLRIRTRVLDKDNGNAVVFDHTVTDTPESDPVLPSGTVRRIPGGPDPSGIPWPLQANPNYVGLVMQWANSEHGPQPLAQVIYDNLEVRLFESPSLSIQRLLNTVLLSWPLTQGQFVLESAPGVNGPYAQVPNPSWQTNNAQNEVTIQAPDHAQFFRLHQVD